MPPLVGISESISCFSNFSPETTYPGNDFQYHSENLVAFENLAFENVSESDIIGSATIQLISPQISAERQPQTCFMYGMLVSKINELKGSIEKIKCKIREIVSNQAPMTLSEDLDQILKIFDENVLHLKKVCEVFRSEDAFLCDNTLFIIAHIEKAKQEMLEELQKTSDNCKMIKNLFGSFYKRCTQWKRKFVK